MFIFEQKLMWMCLFRDNQVFQANAELKIIFKEKIKAILWFQLLVVFWMGEIYQLFSFLLVLFSSIQQRLIQFLLSEMKIKIYTEINKS